MPNFPFVEMVADRARNDALGPVTLNQLQENILAVDELARVEHTAAGGHNALEVPWILGRIADGSPPTGTLFDTSFGGSSFARPVTGRYTLDAAAGVIGTGADGGTLYSAMANVCDNGIETKPHTVTVEAVSATSFAFRVRALSSALGAGDTWADVNRNIDVGLHSLPQDASASLLSSHLEKQRRDFLTEAATDWNAIVQNQGRVRKAALQEHTAAGAHNINRIAKAVAWVRWTGAAYELTLSQGVASVSLSSTGVATLTMSDNFTALTTMACFPEVQPATTTELAITNGRAFNTGAGTSTFRFYTYTFDGANWARADRSFFVAMFGVIA